MKRAPAPTGCLHAPQCVPCPLRGLPYREQLSRKRQEVERALAAYPSLAGADLEDVVGSRDLFGYRNTVKLVVGASRSGGLRAGVYEPGTHRLADASGCAVHHPALNAVIAAALEDAAAVGITAYDEKDGTGELRYLVARYSAWTRRVLLILVTRSREVRGLREIVRKLSKSCRALGGVVQNVNPDPGNVILGRSFLTLRPPAALVDRIGFLKLQTSPGVFLQANLWAARRIYETVLEWAAPEEGDTAVDLFAGVGPLTLYLATRAACVFGVEEVPGAVKDARSNARRNGFHNVRFREGVAEAILPDLVAEIGKAEIVTLNPPRKGALPAVIEGITRLAPRRIAYVSCNPASLARDLDQLGRLGYKLVRLRPFDMLPQTEHVEVVALLESC